MQTYPTQAPPQFQPIRTGKAHKFRHTYGYTFPHPDDIFPMQLYNWQERHTLFVDCMFWFGRPRNWRMSRNFAHVHKYAILKARSGTRRFHLSFRALQSIAATVWRYCWHNLGTGRTQARFTEIQASRGRWSGFVRRERTAERDAEICERVSAGEAKKALAREYGLAPSTVRHICARGATNQSLNAWGSQEEVVYGVEGLRFWESVDAEKPPDECPAADESECGRLIDPLLGKERVDLVVLVTAAPSCRVAVAAHLGLDG